MVKGCAEGQIPPTVGYVDDRSGYLLVQGEKNFLTLDCNNEQESMTKEGGI